jgi:hypothetical protein
MRVVNFLLKVFGILRLAASFSRFERITAFHPLRKFDLVFSMSALRVFKRAHKREVEKAMRDGRNVPERVLEEFPDLKDGN